MLKYELNKLKRGRGSPSNSTASKDLARPSYAGVSLSDIRVPLMWKRKDHLKDVGDNRRFAVFCLARIGAQIYDSALISPIDRSHTDINIDDVFLFNKVSSHYEVTLEIYAKLVRFAINVSFQSRYFQFFFSAMWPNFLCLTNRDQIFLAIDIYSA